MKALSFALALVVAAIPSAGFAQTFAFTLKNGYTESLTSASVAGGKVEGFKQIPANGRREMTVTLPDGKCEATLMLRFADGNSYDEKNFDFCQYNEFTITFEY